MMAKHFLLVSDFDQTLSFNDSGHLLSEFLGMTVGSFVPQVVRTWRTRRTADLYVSA